MNNGGGIGAAIALAALVLGGIAVETGALGGEVGGIVRTIVLVVIVVAALCLLALVAFLVWYAKHPQGTDSASNGGGKNPRVHVHSSSANEAAGIRYVDKQENPLPQWTVKKTETDGEMASKPEPPAESLGDVDEIVSSSAAVAGKLEVIAEDALGK